jgi:inorganic pyrophosphatase
MLEMMDQQEADQKILAVANRNPRFDPIQGIEQVIPHNLREIEHFFDIYKELEGKHTEIRGWRSAQEAGEMILAARRRYLNAHPGKGTPV